MVTIRSLEITLAIIVGLNTLYSKVLYGQSLLKVHKMCPNFLLAFINIVVYYLYGHLTHAKQQAN